MSTKQLTDEAMALPLPARVKLAQALWKSIDQDMPEADERESIHEAIRRDREMSTGLQPGRSHEEVIRTARRAIKCN